MTNFDEIIWYFTKQIGHHWADCFCWDGLFWIRYQSKVRAAGERSLWSTPRQSVRSKPGLDWNQCENCGRIVTAERASLRGNVLISHSPSPRLRELLHNIIASEAGAEIHHPGPDIHRYRAEILYRQEATTAHLACANLCLKVRSSYTQRSLILFHWTVTLIQLYGRFYQRNAFCKYRIFLCH